VNYPAAAAIDGISELVAHNHPRRGWRRPMLATGAAVLTSLTAYTAWRRSLQSRRDSTVGGIHADQLRQPKTRHNKHERDCTHRLRSTNESEARRPHLRLVR
jgi:hypothetical protein